MTNTVEAVDKICSKVHKYVDQKNTEKLLPLLKQLEGQKPKDLSEKDRKKIYEVGSRVKRKFEKEDDVRHLAAKLKEKFASEKSNDKKSDDKKSNDKKSSDKKSSDTKTDGKKTDDKKTSSSKSSKTKDDVKSKSKDRKDSSKAEPKKSGSGSEATTLPAASGLGWEATEPIPKRHKTGVLIFPDFPDFQPNLTPKEVLQAGSFGGTYFRPIYSSVTKQKYGPEVWKELPQDWLQGLDIKKQVASLIYDEKLNKYKAKCGGSLQMWEESGWITAQDPYGWFQWYCRFYQGRRTEDDARQVSRWWNCASVNGRWRNNLISKIFKAGAKFDNAKISPVVRQTLLHWAYDLTEDDYLKRAKKLSK